LGSGERALDLSEPALTAPGLVTALAALGLGGPASVQAQVSARALVARALVAPASTIGASWQPRPRQLCCSTVRPMLPRSQGGSPRRPEARSRRAQQ